MIRVGGPLLAMLLLVTPAMAQDADRIELKGVVGTTGFVDTPTNYHFAVGGAVRLALFRAVSVEPEFLYLRESSRHEDYSLQTAVTWEFRSRTDLRPYLVAGVGVLHSRFKFPGALEERFSSNEFRRRWSRSADSCRQPLLAEPGVSGWMGAACSRNRWRRLHVSLSGNPGIRG